MKKANYNYDINYKQSRYFIHFELALSVPLPDTHIKDFLCVGSCMKQRKKEDWKDAHWTQIIRINKKTTGAIHNVLQLQVAQTQVWDIFLSLSVKIIISASIWNVWT